MIDFIIKFLFRKDVQIMAMIYATLIVKGIKKITDVPMVIREEVRQILKDLDMPEEVWRD